MNKHDRQFQVEVLESIPMHLSAGHVDNNSWDVECLVCRKLVVCQTRDASKQFLADHLCCNVATEIEVEAAEVSEDIIPEVIPAHLVVETMRSGNKSVTCKPCQEGCVNTPEAAARFLHRHLECRPAKKSARKLRAKKSITEKSRKVRTRTSKQVVEDVSSYPTKKLQELAVQPYTDTGLEVCPDAVHVELCKRYDKAGEELVREYCREPETSVVGSIGFDWQDEATAAPITIEAIVEAPAKPPVILLTIIPPPIRPDMIRKSMPPAPPADFEWIPPPFTKKIA